MQSHSKKKESTSSVKIGGLKKSRTRRMDSIKKFSPTKINKVESPTILKDKIDVVIKEENSDQSEFSLNVKMDKMGLDLFDSSIEGNHLKTEQSMEKLNNHFSNPKISRAEESVRDLVRNDSSKKLIRKFGRGD